MSKNNDLYQYNSRKGVRLILWCTLLLGAALLVSCAPTTSTQQGFDPFSVRDGGKSKIVYAPAEIFLEDQYASVVCTGRPTAIRIQSFPERRVLATIPVDNAIPMEDGWHASFPLFDGLSAYFRPGDMFLLSCWGANGTDGSTMKVTAYYTHGQLLNAENE